MIPDRQYTAVVDRIEDGLATLEVTGDEKQYELTVPTETLPADAQHADAILEVTLIDEEIAEVTYDQHATATQAQQAQDRFDRLSQRPPSDDDT